jgi:hypothetical protein
MDLKRIGIFIGLKIAEVLVAILVIYGLYYAACNIMQLVSPTALPFTVLTSAILFFSAIILWDPPRFLSVYTHKGVFIYILGVFTVAGGIIDFITLIVYSFYYLGLFYEWLGLVKNILPHTMDTIACVGALMTLAISVILLFLVAWLIGNWNWSGRISNKLKQESLDKE